MLRASFASREKRTACGEQPRAAQLQPPLPVWRPHCPQQERGVSSCSGSSPTTLLPTAAVAGAGAQGPLGTSQEALDTSTRMDTCGRGSG